MSTGKLKAQFNRVRTSAALKTTSIWENTIGLSEEARGSNAVIEASIYAPGGAGRGRAAKQQRAQELIEASGYEPSVKNFADLTALARRSGGDAAMNRGACKICGGLGHLTKQNFLDSKSGAPAAAAAGAGAAAGGDDDRALLREEDEAALLASDSLDGSGSSDDEARKRKHSSSSKKSSKKEKKSKRSKDKRSKRERRSRSRERSRRNRSRSRSRDRRERRDRSRSRSGERGRH